jgi:shikimate dehydrogenase
MVSDPNLSSVPQALDASTRICAVYGFPVRHSASPAMQNAGIEAMGLNWKYVAFETPPTHLPAALDGAAAMRFVGVNLTVPHKTLALDCLDAIDPEAARLGAVNTVRFETLDPVSGDWVGLGQMQDWPDDNSPVRAYGFNTDGFGFIKALEEDLSWKPEGQSAVLLGVGGAGRAAALTLASRGLKRLYIVNRTAEKSEELASTIRSQFPGVEALVGYPASDSNVDLVINATSLGLKAGDPLPLDVNELKPEQIGAAFDMIYRPSQTPFLKLLADSGVRTANGVGMLLWQGVKALEIWTGREAPVEPMRAALLGNVYGGGKG